MGADKEINEPRSIFNSNLFGKDFTEWVRRVTRLMSGKDPMPSTVVASNPDITPSTKTKITYDKKGLVTGGADATTADIADSLDRRYVGDDQLSLLGTVLSLNTGVMVRTLDSIIVRTITNGAGIGITNGDGVLGDVTITNTGVIAFNGRAGGVVPASGDYTWAQINKATSSISDITTRSHALLTDVGTNTHADIDSHISDSSDPHGTTLTQTNITLSGTITGSILMNSSTLPTLFGTGSIVAYNPTSDLNHGSGFYAQIPNVAQAFGGMAVGYASTPKWLVGISKNYSDTTALVVYEDAMASKPRIVFSTGGAVTVPGNFSSDGNITITDYTKGFVDKDSGSNSWTQTRATDGRDVYTKGVTVCHSLIDTDLDGAGTYGVTKKSTFDTHTAANGAAVHGLGTASVHAYTEGTWTPSPVNLLTTGSPTYSGTYRRMGSMIMWWLQVNANGGTTASTEDSTYFTGFPFNPTATSPCMATNGSTKSLGIGLMSTNGRVWTPTWAAYGSTVFVSGFCYV